MQTVLSVRAEGRDQAPLQRPQGQSLSLLTLCATSSKVSTMVTKTIENLQAELAELDLTEAELRADPCLASCCLKDIKERREVAVVKQKLLSHDPTAQRQNLRATPLGAAHLQAVTQAQPSEDSDAGSDAGGDSQALADIRARRLRELQRSAEAQRSQSQQGAGQLQDVPESQLLVSGQPRAGLVHSCLRVTRSIDTLTGFPRMRNRSRVHPRVLSSRAISRAVVCLSAATRRSVWSPVRDAACVTWP